MKRPVVKRKTEAIVWFGGEAGDGIASAGDIWIKTASRSGLGAFAHNSYQSVIRGGHVLLQSRVGKYPVLSQGEGWDALIALDRKTVDLHLPSARPDSVLLFNADKVDISESDASARRIGLPVGELMKGIATLPVIQNTVLLAALIQMTGMDWNIFEEAIRSIFGKRRADLADMNTAAARAGWEYVQKHHAPLAHIYLKGDGERRMVITGNQAIGFGAIEGGCKFYAAYPMTPASSIMHWLASRAEKHGMLMKQTEDEIAAINMAVGAGFAGARPMVGTSGGGFALMTEAVGMAGMLEAPVTVVISQRGGPSTGLPTKTEQGDLFQALGASQGEYPKALLAPIDVPDAYASTIEALNLADAFQMPVLLLSDLYLSEHTEVVSKSAFDLKVNIDRGPLLDAAPEGYRRFEDTPSGVSPRVLPGTPGGMHAVSTDEHNEGGELISDVFTNPSIRRKMMEKRMRKLEGVKEKTRERAVIFRGPPVAQITLIGWGSTFAVLEEAREILIRKGIRVNHIHFRMLWPFPAEQARKLLKKARHTVCVENNFSGLIERLLRQETGLEVKRSIRKYDGEPFAVDRLAEAILNSRSRKAPAVQVLYSPELDIPMVHK